MSTKDRANGGIAFLRIEREEDLPAWAPRETLESFLHVQMKPYEDAPRDIRAALDYCFSADVNKGGFLMLAETDGRLGAVCVMLRTGMGGYVPEWLLLMVGVDSSLRGRGIGGQLVQRCLAEAGTAVKLHVEYANPAKRLYERLGFTTKYAEMRYFPEAS